MSDTCGCCTPNAPLTPVAIGNRPGLSAVACRVGTFGSFRETMLDAIAGTPELALRGSFDAKHSNYRLEVRQMVPPTNRKHHATPTSTTTRMLGRSMPFR